MADKHALLEQVLPVVELSVNSNGILLSSERIAERRFVAWDQGGRCRECKATEVEVDYMITKEGVTLWSTRIKGARFVPFDAVYDLPGHTFIRMRNKGRVYNIPHGLPDAICVQPIMPPQAPPPPVPAHLPPLPPPTDFSTLAAQMLEPPPPPPPMATIRSAQSTQGAGVKREQELHASALLKRESDELDGDVQTLMDSIGAATHGLDWAAGKEAPKDVPRAEKDAPAVHQQQQQLQKDLDELADVQQMMDSIAAATYGLDWNGQEAPPAGGMRTI